MCTVTFIPNIEASELNSFLITFNRDEAIGRETFPPSCKTEEGVGMVFPKDGVAGGTWLGISSRKRVVGIMNGGFKAHKRNPPYRKSRGVVVKEFLATENFIDFTKDYNFLGIEPFTLLVVEFEKTCKGWQLVWDGTDLHQSIIDNKPAIWSSSPLYDKNMHQKRQNWFAENLNKKGISAEALWNFHHNAGEGNPETNLVVDRGFLKTQSISQIEISEKKQHFKYEDLSTGKLTFLDLSNLMQKEHSV
ncbi:NRDE family protein [Zunongwangia sp.]|uniref:NRDE family protein n=1 Tax=Zunongwangia sp. TaxID=1965325 RepID=UPI003AA9715E